MGEQRSHLPGRRPQLGIRTARPEPDHGKLALAVTGCHVAVNHYLDRSRAGAIVNVSSHQARRPVRGALPYATAKAAIEGLTRAIAVDHGPAGIRANAVGYLLSPQASFINGVTLPVDGGRAVLGVDPEAVDASG